MERPRLGSGNPRIGVTEHDRRSLRRTWYTGWISARVVTPEKLAQGYHVNHTLWDYSGVPCNSWVEIGLTYGCHGSTGYHYYEAIKRYGSGAYADYEISSTSNDGSTHSYLVYYYSSSPIEWVAYLDGYQRGVFTSGSDQGDLGYGA